MVKYYVIAVLIIYSFAISEQDTSKVYSQKLDKLRTELGMGENTEFDDIAYGLLVKKLDSLKIKDHQLEDGYEWGGGKIGFDVYLKNNIDSILFHFGHTRPGECTEIIWCRNQHIRLLTNFCVMS